MLTEFSQRVIQLIQNIPEGKVSTYGQIADLAGRPKAARRVSWLLNSSSDKYQLPWHRVINSQGKISERPGGGQQRQKKRLAEEGIKVSRQYEVDLKKYLWTPETINWEEMDIPEEAKEFL